MDIRIEERLYEYWIGSMPGLKANKIEAMLKFFGSPKQVYRASVLAMEQMIKTCSADGIAFSSGELEMIIAGKDMDVIKKNMEYLNKHGIKFVTKLDSLYPDKLRNIYDSPFLLYYKGKPFPQNKKVISVVGARNCTVYGSETAKYLAAALAREDIVIVSGLARGIDSYAHIGALSAECITYGVMGCGIDICYPVENINLYMDMQLKGGIISEYQPGSKPLAYHFPMRNRIISALSDGILVIEAREKSGSLITVDMGLDQGKNIYAVPGRISDRLSEGCNNLIKSGAKLVMSPMDILEDLIPYIQSDETNQLAFIGVLPHDEQIIYELISLAPKHIEELIELTGFEIGCLMEHLLSLELKDMINQPIKNFYIKNRV